jgi:hypothetical protein
MKKMINYSLWLIFNGILVILLVRFWYSKPKYFPEFLRKFGLWLVNLMGCETPESKADAELMFIVLVAIIVCITTTFLIKNLWNRRAA